MTVKIGSRQAVLVLLSQAVFGIVTGLTAMKKMMHRTHSLNRKQALTLLTALLLTPLVALRAADAPPARALLLANYYCWYHDGQHPKQPFLHWTYPSSATNALAKKAQKPGEPPPNSVFRPLAGFYDSADPKVAEWHVQLAKAAGMDAFLVDWWDTHNQLDQNVDRGIVAAAIKHGFYSTFSDFRDDPYVIRKA